MTAWTYRTDANRQTSAIIGYDVVAADGSIGQVTEESVDVGNSHIVVDTGFWILDKKRLVPAGAVTGIDHDRKQVMLSMTTDEVKGAPDFVEESRVDDVDSYREQHASYYFPWIPH